MRMLGIVEWEEEIASSPRAGPGEICLFCTEVLCPVVLVVTTCIVIDCHA